LDPSGRMLLGSEPLAAAALLTAAGADLMGLNCSTGPKEMVDPLRALAENAPLPLSCQPNAGIPENREGTAVYPLQASELAEHLTRVVRVLSGQIEAPLCIDSTEPEVIAASLEWLPGVGIVNSVHLERGWEKIDKIFPLLKQYGTCTVAMAIDEKGMALTAQRKLEVARRIYERALKDGLQPWQLLFDVLTFTLATGDEQYKNSAVETIEGIGLVKEKLPGALTVLGVSNVSFGLAKQTRPILNSVFLTHCLKAGLDAAIIN